MRCSVSGKHRTTKHSTWLVEPKLRKQASSSGRKEKLRNQLGQTDVNHPKGMEDVRKTLTNEQITNICKAKFVAEGDICSVCSRDKNDTDIYTNTNIVK